jgi:hypothetical protein
MRPHSLHHDALAAQEDVVETLVIIAIAVAGLVVFDIAALRWGADSRPCLTDDHRR